MTPNPVRGIVLMVCAVSTFGCMDTLAKLLAQHYPVPMIVWARYTLHIIAMIVFFTLPFSGREASISARFLGLVRTRHLRFQLVRGAVLVASSLVFFTALSVMPLAEASALTYLSPLLVAVLAGPVLHERVAPITWVALVGGFIGVALIVRPGAGVFSWAAMLPLAVALLMAIYQIMTRKLAGVDRAITTLFYPGLVGTVLVPVLFPITWAFPPNWVHVAMLVGLGIGGAAGHLMLIKAMGHAPATTLAPFVYAQIVSVIVLGLLVFGQFPDGLSLVGITVIVASGLAVAAGHRWARRGTPTES